MGDHYIPKYYLKGFSENEGKTIFVYDKIEKRCFATQVKSIANETGFYSPGIETYLSNDIEIPANKVLKKIRERLPILDNEKQALSAYMVCMIKRVPKGKETLKVLAPDVAESVNQEFNDILNIAAITNPDKNEIIEKHRREIQEIIDKYSKDPPKEIWLDNIALEKSPRFFEALNSMTWRFVTFDEYPAFLTSDNPLFFFPVSVLETLNLRLSFQYQQI